MSYYWVTGKRAGTYQVEGLFRGIQGDELEMRKKVVSALSKAVFPNSTKEIQNALPCSSLKYALAVDIFLRNNCTNSDKMKECLISAQKIIDRDSKVTPSFESVIFRDYLQTPVKEKIDRDCILPKDEKSEPSSSPPTPKGP